MFYTVAMFRKQENHEVVSLMVNVFYASLYLSHISILFFFGLVLSS